jgi:GT2 family glycosyltransferase
MQSDVELRKIVVGLPSCGLVRVETVVSLSNMLANSQVAYQLYAPMSCYIHMNREETVKKALADEADYILFVDADMEFPYDALTKLLTMDKDIASVTYNFRELPKRSIVKLDEKYDSDYAVDDSVTERPIPLNKINNPFRCASAGTGLMLIKVDVFRKMQRPWFFFTPETDTQGAGGEDVWFCDRAREYGYEIWIDPSIQVDHIGTARY